MQVCITALLLVALTFYSALTLGNTPISSYAQRSAAIAILCVLVVPFGCFLWWLTLGRLLAHKVNMAEECGSCEVKQWHISEGQGCRKNVAEAPRQVRNPDSKR